MPAHLDKSQTENGNAAAAESLPSRELNRRENQGGALENEEIRIREVYAERKRAIPAERYSSQNPGNQCIRRELERRLLANLARFHCQPLSSRKILDVGCGPGVWLQKFLEWGAIPEKLFGVDLMEDRIARARQDLPQGVTLNLGSASQLNFPDENFDLVTQYVVFSSVLHAPTRNEIAKEMLRVLKPGGHIIWYDFFRNNPWNSDVRGVKKNEIRELFPQCQFHFEQLTVAPPLTRKMSVLAPALYPAMATLKVFSTHYLAFITK